MVALDRYTLSEQYVSSIKEEDKDKALKIQTAFLVGFDAAKKLIPCEDSMPEDYAVLCIPSKDRTQEVLCFLGDCYTVGYREIFGEEYEWVLDLDAEIKVISWRPIHDYIL